MPISKSNGAVATPPAPVQSTPAEVAQTAPAPVSRKLDTGMTTNGRDDRKPSYDDNKNRRILVQGIVQAVVQSPALAGLGYTDQKQIMAIVKSAALELIEFVDEESK